MMTKSSFSTLLAWGVSLAILLSGVMVSLHVMAEEGEMPRCMPDEELLTEIKKRRQELDQKQQVLQKKDEELATREKVLKEEFKKLEDLRNLLGTEKAAENAKMEERVAKLVETLQTMSPKASAKLFSEISEELAVETMTKMDTPKLAKILNLLDPVKSSILSEKLAGREPKRPIAKAEKSDTAERAPAQTSAQAKEAPQVPKEKSILPPKENPKKSTQSEKEGGSSNANPKNAG